MSDANELLERIEVTTGPEPTAAVIWLHGLGADGGDFESIVPELRLPPELPVRFVFPHAPVRAVTINMGMVMRAWYDVKSLELDRLPDEAGIADSAAHIERLIAHEKTRGIPAERIVLAGFSQGGAMTYHVGLRHEERLAGLLVMSAYAPQVERVEKEAAEVNRRTPVFHGHGLYDDLVPPELGEASVARLGELGYDIAHRTYPVAHGVHPQEIADVGRWLTERLLPAG